MDIWSTLLAASADGTPRTSIFLLFSSPPLCLLEFALSGAVLIPSFPVGWPAMRPRSDSVDSSTSDSDSDRFHSQLTTPTQAHFPAQRDLLNRPNGDTNRIDTPMPTRLPSPESDTELGVARIVHYRHVSPPTGKFESWDRRTR